MNTQIKLMMSLTLAMTVLFVSGVASAQDAVVEKGKTVKIDYSLTVDGNLVETTEGKEPLSYPHGEGQIIPGLSTALDGMKVGEEKTVAIEPADAYGDVNPEALREVEKSQFPEDFEFNVGTVVQLNTPEGATVAGIIAEVKETTVVVDFNHPLAGKKLEFKVKIVGIE